MIRTSGNLAVHEQCKQKNDRQRNSQYPKQCASTKTHLSLHRYVRQLFNQQVIESQAADPERGCGSDRSLSSGSA